MKYIHRDTHLGSIQVRGNGFEVDCVVTVLGMPGGGPISEHTVEFLFQNRATDHEAGMQPLIDGALAKRRALAEAFIAARTAA